MKTILLPLLFILSTSLYAGTCTTTSRTNYSVGQVLTSSALNADLNQLVTKSNGLDGGCVTDGSLEAASLNATDFAAVTNGIHQGCTVSYSDVNTVSVGKCITSINGNFVKTSTASTVTWLCSGCSAEAASTQYYVYGKTGSTGTTLNLLISNTAPGADGYDVSGNKILGKFFNNYSSDIESREVLSWANNFYAPNDKVMTLPGTTVGVDFFAVLIQGGGASGECNSTPCTLGELLSTGNTTGATRSAAGTYVLTTANSYDLIRCHYSATAAGNPLSADVASNTTPTTIQFFTKSSAGALTDSAITAFCFGRRKN